MNRQDSMRASRKWVSDVAGMGSALASQVIAQRQAVGTETSQRPLGYMEHMRRDVNDSML